MRVLYFGDASWGAESLRQLCTQGVEVAGVVIRAVPTDDALELAAGELCLQTYQLADCNAPEFLDTVTQLAPDLNISVSYNQILRREILESAPLGFINFHAGKLPFYRGRSVVNWAIINGEQEIGITGHFVDEGIDTGDIILQRTLPIAWTDTYGDVMDKVAAAFPDLVADTVALIDSGQFERRKQSHLPGSYFPVRGVGDEWLDWSDTSFNLYNKIRGITRPAPGALTVLDGRQITIWRALYDPDWPKYIANPGQVVGRLQDGVIVKTGDSTLLVQEIQPAGGEPQVPTWRIGTRLGGQAG